MSVWGDLAESQMVSPTKARMRAAEKRKQKRLQERDTLFRQWRKWHKERREELLAGKWNVAARELADFLERMTLEDAYELIERIEHGPWRDADRDTRFLVQIMTSHIIIELREKAGLEPFDDPMPGEEPNASMIIKETLSD